MAVGLFPNRRCHACLCATEQQQRRAGALKASCNLIDHRAESKAAHDDGCVRLPRSAVVLLCRALEDMEEEVTVDFLTVAALCLIGTRSASVRAAGGCAGGTNSSSSARRRSVWISVQVGGIIETPPCLQVN